MNALTHLIISVLIVSGIASLALNLMTIHISQAKGWLSAVDFRRKKKRRVPLLGGVPLFLALGLSAFIFQIEASYALLLAGLPLIVAGALDDIRELSAKQKLVGQIFSIGIWAYLVPTHELVLVQIGLSSWLSLSLTGFWILGLINSLNMIDGMDSEASGIALIVGLFFLLLLGINDPQVLMVVSVVGSCCGFLFFNWPPARIYLGDGGSTFLGLFLGMTASKLSLPSDSTHFVLVPLFLLAFPQIDTLLSIFRRLKSRTSILKGDHDHIHHKLMKLGLSVPQVLAVLFSVTAYCGLTALLFWRIVDPLLVFGIFLLSICALLGILGAVYFLEYRQAHQVSSYSQTLISQHLKIKESISIDSSSFRAVLYDLMPYYKELQSKGIVRVQEFIQDFADFVNEHHPHGELKMIGVYSVVAIESPREFIVAANEAIVKDFYNLVARHQVQKNDSGYPWGLSIYLDSERGDQFLNKMGLYKDKDKDQVIPLNADEMKTGEHFKKTGSDL